MATSTLDEDQDQDYADREAKRKMAGNISAPLNAARRAQKLSSGARGKGAIGNPNIQRGGLGIPGQSNTSNVQRGGFGETGKRMAGKAVDAGIDKTAQGLALETGGASLVLAPVVKKLKKPILYVLIIIIFLIGILLFMLLDPGKFIQDNTTVCSGTTGTTDTLKLNLSGPTTAKAGDPLQYTITINDTQQDQDVTVVDHVDTASLNPADIQSSWSKFTVDANAKTITWKASENQGAAAGTAPNNAQPPANANSSSSSSSNASPNAGAGAPATNTGATSYTFTVTLKATADNSNLVNYAEANATRNGSAAGATAGTKPVIVLDPGHSGTDTSVTDPATGLQDHDYPNIPEIDEVWQVAQAVKTKLEADGYTVILTKNAARDTVGHRARADIANNAHAALAVSIHDDHTQSWDSFAQVYTQKVDLYRTKPDGSKVSFTDANLAQQSQADGQKIQAARQTAEGRNVSNTDASFDGRSGIAGGNIPLVMLFATVPWVYNEVGAGPGNNPLPQDQLDKYSNGLVTGIEAAVPANGAAPAGSTTGNGQPASGNQPAGSTGGGCPPAGNNGTTGGTVPNGPVPPSDDNCGGKYTLNSPFKNFGDPKCDFQGQGQLDAQLQQLDSADATTWDCIAKHESNFNPNAYNPNSTSGKGATGLFQMNPQGQGNGEYDAGNVVWSLQASNAVNYRNDAIGGSWAYWGTRGVCGK